jgi:hypothetical protein
MSCDHPHTPGLDGCPGPIPGNDWYFRGPRPTWTADEPMRVEVVPQGALVLVDGGTGEQLHLPPAVVDRLVGAVRAYALSYPSLNETAEFIGRTLGGR